MSQPAPASRHSNAQMTGAALALVLLRAVQCIIPFLLACTLMIYDTIGITKLFMWAMFIWTASPLLMLALALYGNAQPGPKRPDSRMSAAPHAYRPGASTYPGQQTCSPTVNLSSQRH